MSPTAVSAGVLIWLMKNNQILFTMQLSKVVFVKRFFCFLKLSKVFFRCLNCSLLVHKRMSQGRLERFLCKSYYFLIFVYPLISLNIFFPKTIFLTSKDGAKNSTNSLLMKGSP